MVRLSLLPDERALPIFRALALVPAQLVASPVQDARFITVITSSFLHAGWLHLAGNVLFLAVFGPAVESRMGHLRFTALYFAGAVAGAAAYVWFAPSGTAPLVGASAAIAAVLGAHLVLEPTAKTTVLVPVLLYFELASVPAALLITLWFVAQVAATLAPVAAHGADQVAWHSHIAGFLVGAAIAAPGAWRAKGAARSGTNSRSRQRSPLSAGHDKAPRARRRDGRKVRRAA